MTIEPNISTKIYRKFAALISAVAVLSGLVSFVSGDHIHVEEGKIFVHHNSVFPGQHSDHCRHSQDFDENTEFAALYNPDFACSISVTDFEIRFVGIIEYFEKPTIEIFAETILSVNRAPPSSFSIA